MSSRSFVAAATLAVASLVAGVTLAAPAAKPAAEPVVKTTVTPVTTTPATEAADAAPSGPVGKVEIKETLFDAGTVERGADITHAFELKNVGPGPLTVEAKPGCGCTVVDYDKVIAPGASGKINASIHTTNFKGEVTKSVTVTTNDPANKSFTLQLRGKILVPVDVQPSENVNFDGKAGAIEPSKVTVVANGGETFDIVSAESSDTHYTVTVAPNLVAEPGKPAPKAPKTKSGTLGSGMSSYIVTITPASDLAIGRGAAQVTLKTTHPKAAEVVIRVSSFVRGDIDVLPERVTLRLGSSQPEAAKVQHVAIRKREGDALKILGVETSNPAIKTTLKTVTEGQEYDLEVKYDGAPPTAVVNADVTIKTNDPKQSAIKVVVYGFPEAQVVNPGQQGGIQVKPVAGTASAGH